MEERVERGWGGGGSVSASRYAERKGISLERPSLCMREREQRLIDGVFSLSPVLTVTVCFSERQFYMFSYKTKKCQGFPYNCHCNGMEYHRPQGEILCPISVFVDGECEKGVLVGGWGDVVV